MSKSNHQDLAMNVYAAVEYLNYCIREADASGVRCTVDLMRMDTMDHPDLVVVTAECVVPILVKDYT